jgi:hypothetical protein
MVDALGFGASPSQFYVEPAGDYREGLLGLGAALGDWRRETEAKTAAEQAAAKEDALKAEAARLYREGTSEDIRQFTAANPEWGQIVMEQSSLRDQENALALTNTFYAAKDDPTKISQLLDAYEARLKLNGLTDQEAQEIAEAREKSASDPEGFLKSMEISVAPLDFDRYDRWVASQAEPEVDDDSTSDIKNFNRYLELKETDPEAAEAFGRSQGYITDPTGTGVSKQKTAAFRVRDPETGEVGVAVGVFDPSSGTLTTQTATFEDYQIVSTLGETAMEQTEREIEQTRQEKIVTGAEEEAASLITRGVLAAESTAPLRRAIELIEFVPTGGFDAASLKAKQIFGIESADEGELSNMLGKAVLSQLRETFGAAFTESEGARLANIEASFGKSPEANKRLLEQALAIAENTSQRALKAAEGRGDTRTMEDIQSLLDFSLTPEPETVTETTDQNPVIGTKAAYDSLPSGALYVNQTTGKLMRKP